MTIDETINTHKLQSNESRNYNDRRGVFYDAEEHEQLAEWLEELKALREKTYDKGYVQGTIDRAEEVTMARVHGYNKAIDDFEKMAKEVKYQDGALSNIDLEYIAERLKAGGEDGR